MRKKAQFHVRKNFKTLFITAILLNVNNFIFHEGVYVIKLFSFVTDDEAQ